MWIPGWREWAFSAKTCGAALLALLIALWADLSRPYWAVATVYIVTQPLSGATRSKGVYRIFGTLVGVVATIALLPNLVNAPELLVLAIALWVALCLYLALLDRTPRAYLFMLSGYTVALIGFPAVEEPGTIFDTAVARAEEICLGIVCATLVSSLVLPQPVGPAVSARIDAWLQEAGLWTSEVLSSHGADPGVRAQRLRLAVDAAEIDALTTHLGFDDGGKRVVPWLRILHGRMLMLLPILSSLADRIAALRARGELSDEIEDILRRVEAWSRAEAPPAEEAHLLRSLIAGADGPIGRGATWNDLLRASLLQRLKAFVEISADCRLLRAHIARGGGPLRQPLAWRSEFNAVARHRDHGMALRSALSAFLTILVCAAFWIATEWPDGATAALMAAMVCCLFATQDDPAPTILSFAHWSTVAAIGAVVLQFAVLPRVQDFETLAYVLAVPLLLCGLLMARPKTAHAGIAVGLNGPLLLALQETYSADLAALANTALALIGGLWVAALMTRLVRSVGAEQSAMRLLRAGRAALADAAQYRGRGDRAVFAALMLDRLCLLVPRLAAAAPDSPVRKVDSLAQMRTGMNIVVIRRARHTLPTPCVAAVDAVLDSVARQFRAPDAPPDQDLRHRIDAALALIVGTAGGDGRRAALLGLTGLRQSLFPDAPPYSADEPSGAAARRAASAAKAGPASVAA
ncbi:MULTISPECIES: FUSC family protein [unclassified Methylobacterium]|uniref:FUSC family protein n=1 Tax=unclassified Methylobacterium TaxID=2615210 RepID=UPI0013559671|nr:FUSC family protein [Methylobacterium sp. 2A]